MTRATDVAQVVETAERWQEVGGTGVGVVTMFIGLDTADAHIDHISAVMDGLDAQFGQP